MSKLSKGYSRGKNNKIKDKGASRLTYKDSNVVMDFNEEEINKLALEYRNTIATYKIINATTIEVTSKLLKNIWFLENHENFIAIKHMNNGEQSVRTHSQFETYTLRESFRTIATHDCYKSAQLDYRKTDMGKLFELISKGQQKIVKLS